MLCECGCGKETPLAKRTGRGYVVGQPQRFAVGHYPRSRTGLSSDELRSRVQVDLVDRDLLHGHIWRLTKAGYVHREVLDQTVYLHRLILGLRPGDGLEGDHINRDKLDCRRSNLRVVTHAENMQNLAAIGRGGTSEHRGVSFDASRGRWRATCRIGRRQHAIGRFATEPEAVEAVVAFRREHMPFSAADRVAT